MVMGRSNKEIGTTLDVTEGTVKVHVNHILSKLGVAGRVEAILVAIQRGFVHILGGHQDPSSSHTGEKSNASRPLAADKNISKVIGSAKSSGQLHPKK